MNKLSERPQNKNFGKVTTKANQEKYEINFANYNLNPRLCEYCSSPLPYEHRKNRFCSRHCAGLYNSPGKILTEEHKIKTSKALKTFYELNPRTDENNEKTSKSLKIFYGLNPKEAKPKKHGQDKKTTSKKLKITRLSCDP